MSLSICYALVLSISTSDYTYMFMQCRQILQNLNITNFRKCPTYLNSMSILYIIFLQMHGFHITFLSLAVWSVKNILKNKSTGSRPTCKCLLRLF